MKLLIILIFLISYYSFSNNNNDNDNIEKKIQKGLIVYKKANCMGCHSWHGKGGGGYGAGVSLRTKSYSIDELINIINCGIPGTGMPYFNKNSYVTKKCYGTLMEDDVENKPKNSKKFINTVQTQNLAVFIYHELQNKELDKKYCHKFFNKDSKVCKIIK